LEGPTLPSTRAVRLLTGRMARSMEAITDVLRIRGEDGEFDGTTLLRTIYDTHLQGLYILQDPEPRATLYLNFVFIEWHRWKKMLLENKNPLTESILQSMADGDGQFKKSFDEFERAFRIPDKPSKHRENWYVGNLTTIAQGVGYGSECRYMSRLLNPVVHSSALGLQWGKHPTGIMIQHWGWTCVLRVMGRYCEYEKVILHPEEKKHIDEAYEDIFNPPRAAQYLAGED